jgi:hypothetical protein
MQQLFSFWKDIPVTDIQPKNIFFPEYFKGKARPTNADKEVKLLVIEQILPSILVWLNDTEDSDDIEEITKDLMDEIEPYKDGYKIAKALDDCGWPSDSELVDILDDLDFHNSLNKLTLMWIKANNIKPKFNVGDKVRVNSRLVNLKSNKGRKKFYDGEITKIDPFGKYVVFIEEVGHVRTGRGCHGSYINWEDVEKI